MSQSSSGPALLRALLERSRSERVAELVKSNGPAAASGIRLFSNDYLSFADDWEIVGAMLTALSEGNDFLWMSSVSLEDSSPQRRLERRLAAYLGAQDCALAQSGYCANLGLLMAIAAPGTQVYLDECAHPSLGHGVLASHATPHRFEHNQPFALEALLRESGPGIVIVDSVYSHDGSVCPLRAIVELGTRYECVLVVDESHSLGTHGLRGAGLVVELGLERQVHFRSASLAAAFVARAGLVASSQTSCDVVRYASGPAIFSSACMPHDLACIETALELIARADARRSRLHTSAASLRTRLSALGYAIASDSQIIALESGLETETLRLKRFLEQNAVYGSVLCDPATRLDQSLIRLSLHASLTQAQLDRIVDVCAEARSHVDFEQWASTRRRRARAGSST